MKKLILGILLIAVLGFANVSHAGMTVANLTLTSASTEYTLNVPPNVRQISIKARTGADFQMASTASASGTTYFTVPSGSVYFDTNISGQNAVNLYFQSATAGLVLEIVYITN